MKVAPCENPAVIKCPDFIWKTCKNIFSINKLESKLIQSLVADNTALELNEHFYLTIKASAAIRNLKHSRTDMAADATPGQHYALLNLKKQL